MSNNTNFAFWGTPDVASKTLEILKKEGLLPSVIITSPDKKAGRGLHMQASATARFAEENNIPCLKPEMLDKEFALQLAAFNIQLSIVVAYGKIIPEEILNIPPLGSYNVHYSLLPKYRGASPVESAILNDDKETGVTIQKMIFKMDAGPLVATEKTTIGSNETTPELRERLINMGGKMLVKIIPEIVAGVTIPSEQDESQATYCKKISKEDGLLDLTSDPVKNYNRFRAYASSPRTYFINPPTGGGKRYIITSATLEDGKFVIKRVIPEGKKETEYRISN